MEMTRRNFLTATGTAAAAVAGCSCQTVRSASAEATEETLPEADATKTADVIVVGGAGVSGMVATCHAHDLGLDVLAIDRAEDFGQTNTANYGGVFALETPDRLEWPVYVTKKDFFERYVSECSNQCNFAAVRNMIVHSAETAALVEENAPGFYWFHGTEPATELLTPLKSYASYTVDCWDDSLYGSERVPYLQKSFDDRNINIEWGANATNLLFDGEKVYGVRYTDASGRVVDATADNVIVCCGGCAHNPDLVAELSGGAKVVGIGSSNCDGAGIKMAYEVGAAKGKCFTFGLSEFGAGNDKAVPPFSYIGTEGPLTLMMAAGLYVNAAGERFMPEQTILKGTMFSSDAFSRQGSYFAVVDQSVVDRFTNESVYDAIGAAQPGLNPGMEYIWGDTFISDLQEQMDSGVEQGWIFKGETFEELAQAMGCDALVETLNTYNGYCETGVDKQFYKQADLLQKLEAGPYYAIECMTATFNTIGGVKVDGFCRALDEEGNYIPGLFVTGSDADLWSTQYTYGNTCQGFESMSGYLAAEICAGNTLDYEA